jgi:hypothetical protein
MIKTCYLLKEKLTNVNYNYSCKMRIKNEKAPVPALWNR